MTDLEKAIQSARANRGLTTRQHQHKTKADGSEETVVCPQCGFEFDVNVDDYRTDDETSETGGNDDSAGNDDYDEFDDIDAKAKAITAKVIESLKGKIKPTK